MHEGLDRVRLLLTARYELRFGTELGPQLERR